ncbi:MAG TPA: ABC transporter ATP-binding protein [Candidatus Sphingobacterium stercoripullorum]|nr:ABC transporter ATP-binding protein [Candidatus Sphingobacterium stercoripullorum]
MSHIEFINISKSYGQTLAVHDFNLSINQGEMVALLGPSGCGKTTTLRMLAGFTSVTGGRITIGGSDITAIPAHQRNIGMVFQGYALFPHMTVEQNVAFGLEMRGLSKKELKQQAEVALERVRLREFADRLPKQLSGGQQQRVALARAMVISPEVLLLDEPLSALDARLRHEVRAEIKELQREFGLTTLIVTHDQDEALSMADRLVVMSKGRIEQVGTPDEVYEQPKNRFVAEFLGKINLLEGQSAGSTGFTLHDGTTIKIINEQNQGELNSVCFRPERAQIMPLTTPESSEYNSIVATVRFLNYLGPHIECELTLKDHTKLVVNMPNTSDRDFTLTEGTKVQVRWRPHDTHLLS